MTMWIFGDCPVRYFRYIPETWIQNVATTLNEKVISCVKNRSSLEYTYYRFNQKRDLIKEKDIIIMSFNNIKKRWFFQDPILDPGDPGTDYAWPAIEYYNRYLTNLDENQKTYLVNFLFNINYLAEKRNIHIIVLPNFIDTENIVRPIQKELSFLHFPIGKFGDLSREEWKKEFLNKYGPEWFAKNDVRLNHSIRTNHLIMKDKIVNNILHKETIDLTKGFKTNFLDDKLLQDPDFIKYELFDGFAIIARREDQNK